MNVYLDTSIVLRRLLKQKNSLRSWGSWKNVYSSQLLQIEALRTFDRIRLQNLITDKELAVVIKQFNEVSSCVHEIPISSQVVNRACQSFPTIIGTLDALHLASAIILKNELDIPLVFLTHDKQLGIAAGTLGFDVEGI